MIDPSDRSPSIIRAVLDDIIPVSDESELPMNQESTKAEMKGGRMS